MAILGLSDWKDQFALIPLVADQSWKSEWADWVYWCTSKHGAFDGMMLAGWAPTTSIDFQFDDSTFASSLADSTPGTALANLSTAFQAAMATSVLNITAPMSTPPAEAVASVVVDPASITVASNIILATDLSTPIDDAKNATIITSMRDAILSLTYTVTGTSGGNPATYPNQVVL